MVEVIKFVAQDLYIPVIVFAALTTVIFNHKHLLELTLAAIFITGLSYLISKVAGQLISDPRPFIQTGVAPLIQGAHDNGFPSDHTLLVGAVAGVIYTVSRKSGLLVGLFALVIGLARVYAGVHHLLDIAGSLVIVVITTGLYLAGRGWWQRRLKLRTNRKIPTSGSSSEQS